MHFLSCVQLCWDATKNLIASYFTRSRKVSDMVEVVLVREDVKITEIR